MAKSNKDKEKKEGEDSTHGQRRPDHSNAYLDQRASTAEDNLEVISTVCVKKRLVGGQ